MKNELNVQLEKKLTSNLLKDFILNDTNKNETISDFTTLCLLGRFYLKENNLNKALFYYSQALKLDENSQKLWIIVGTLYYLNGNESLAEKYYFKAKLLNQNITKNSHQSKEKSSIDIKKKKFYRFSCLIR